MRACRSSAGRPASGPPTACIAPLPRLLTLSLLLLPQPPLNSSKHSATGFFFKPRCGVLACSPFANSSPIPNSRGVSWYPFIFLRHTKIKMHSLANTTFLLLDDLSACAFQFVPECLSVLRKDGGEEDNRLSMERNAHLCSSIASPSSSVPFLVAVHFSFSCILTILLLFLFCLQNIVLSFLAEIFHSAPSSSANTTTSSVCPEAAGLLVHALPRHRVRLDAPT